ncbi:unnamed protein product, partial [Ectocarpus sp. 6 AP-2014]
INKKRTLLGVGGSILSIDALAQVYDQYARFRSSGRLESSSSSMVRYLSEMSPEDLSRFQARVSTAAEKLRRSIAQTSDETNSDRVGRRIRRRVGGRRQFADQFLHPKLL